MSNLSDDTLRKILEQIQGQAIATQRSLQIVRAQIQSKEKERKILSLTMREIDAIPKDEDEVKMYKGVGKMFVMRDRSALDVENRKLEKTLGDDLETLNKKAKYLEKQFNEANSQLRDIFHSQARAAEAAS